ncbi:MAG: Epimerase [Verrucomicrobiales bacterium]|nr:Epimerase [Verrucomicrobiales bacterium]
MRVLVTGGAGFIGSHLCEALLHSGHTVYCLDNFDPFYAPGIKRANLANLIDKSEFTLLEGDILDVSFLNLLFSSYRLDQVIHLAAKAGVRPSLLEPGLYQRVNVEGTANILEQCRLHSVNKVIIASSSSVYGESKNIPFTESEGALKPISPYAASKLATEGLGFTYHHLYGMDVVMLRFFTVYGPRQRPDLAITKFANLISQGLPIPVYGDGSTARDYTCITDIVSGIMACTRRSFGYEIINLGESKTVTLKYLIELLEKNLGQKAKIEWLPLQPGDVPFTCADISKAALLLDYSPGTQIESGISSFLPWFNDNKSLLFPQPAPLCP